MPPLALLLLLSALVLLPATGVTFTVPDGPSLLAHFDASHRVEVDNNGQVVRWSDTLGRHVAARNETRDANQRQRCSRHSRPSAA